MQLSNFSNNMQNTQKFQKMQTFLDKLDYSDLRFTSNQNIYLINIAENFLLIKSKIRAVPLFSAIIFTAT